MDGTKDLEVRGDDKMTRYWKYSAMLLLAMAIVVPAASARPGFVIGFGGPFYGPAYYGGWYGPAYGVPYRLGPGSYTGSVKFDTKMKDAGVFVDGGYAGTVKQLGTFPLRPGTHDIEVRNPAGQTIFQEKVDVLAGKTIKLAV
jgi:hypothetical protein